MSQALWYVYGMVCNETSYICYVGATVNPERRYMQHKTDPTSSVYRLFNRTDGFSDPTMVIINTFGTRAEARLLEATLIHSGVGCSNKEFSVNREWLALRQVLGDGKAREWLTKIYEADAESDIEFDPQSISIVVGGGSEVA